MPLIRRYYTKPHPLTGKRIRKPVKKWYCLHKKDGKWTRTPAYSDKASSLQLLAKLERDEARKLGGFIDHFTKNAVVPIAEHIDDFVKHLIDRGSSKDHWKTTEQRTRWICTAAEIEFIGDITKARVDAALAKLTKEDGRSAASRNHYLTAIKGFAKWLVDERRSETNHIAGMHRKSVEGERVKERRPLTAEEFDKLLTAASKSKQTIHGLDGRDRVAVYLLAYATGLRRRELATITPASFEFGQEPFVNVVKGGSKRRREEHLPLKAEIAKHLRAYVANCPASLPLWRIANRNTAAMIQADLKAAKVKFQAGIETVDFHSLRQTFTTGLARSGASPKVTQQLARHSDINLTMKSYAKLNDREERQAVEALSTPSFLAQRLAQGVTPLQGKRRTYGELSNRKSSSAKLAATAPNRPKSRSAKTKKAP